jgi:hypothetical protein
VFWKAGESGLAVSRSGCAVLDSASSLSAAPHELVCADLELATQDAIRLAAMPTSLHSTLNNLAASFADNILAAIRGASLDELVGPSGPPRSNGRLQRSSTVAAAAPKAATRSRAIGRLHRRSPEEIAKTLEQVVAAVKKNPEGLRAEQIRQALGLQAKEMPRILKEGLVKKMLKSKGQKRATTYLSTR